MTWSSQVTSGDRQTLRFDLWVRQTLRKFAMTKPRSGSAWADRSRGSCLNLRGVVVGEVHGDSVAVRIVAAEDMILRHELLPEADLALVAAAHAVLALVGGP